MADVQLCTVHESTLANCLRKTGHDEDGHVAAQLRTNLHDYACTPGKYGCPPLDQKTVIPGYYTSRITGFDPEFYAVRYEFTFHEESK